MSDTGRSVDRQTGLMWPIVDPDLNVVIWGTGNPWGDFDFQLREGDNLYSNSALALDADTGKLR